MKECIEIAHLYERDNAEFTIEVREDKRLLLKYEDEEKTIVLLVMGLGDATKLCLALGEILINFNEGEESSMVQ